MAELDLELSLSAHGIHHTLHHHLLFKSNKVGRLDPPQTKAAFSALNSLCVDNQITPSLFFGILLWHQLYRDTFLATLVILLDEIYFTYNFLFHVSLPHTVVNSVREGCLWLVYHPIARTNSRCVFCICFLIHPLEKTHMSPCLFCTS